MPQFLLAKLYASGRGVPKNIVVSQMWLTLSAAQGNEHAMKARDLLEERMNSAQIAEAQKLVREWKPKPER
jgi:TPR repeat protein